MTTRYECDYCGKPAVVQFTVSVETLPGRTPCRSNRYDVCNEHSAALSCAIADVGKNALSTPKE